MTEEEYADFTERLKNYDMSQAEFIRQAITRATIRPIVTVSPVNDELLSAVGKLTAEYGKIGGNSVLTVSGFFKQGATDTAADKMMKVLEAEATKIGRASCRERV